MLIYILVLYIYRTYAMPTALPPSPFPSVYGISRSSTSPTVLLVPRLTTGHGRNTCSTGERGVCDIIWSCLVTLFACVYKALHPNVPSQELGWRGRLMLKIKLAVFMLLAPEMVIFWATKQLLGAMRVVKEMNKIDPGKHIIPFTT